MARRLTQQEFITLAQSVHGDRYDYSLVRYVNFRTKVTVICHEHGSFEVAPHLHTSNSTTCPTCNKEAKTASLPSFIEQCAAKFDISNLDFQNTSYIGLRHPITVGCKTHGEFTKHSAGSLLASKGCPLCAKRQNGQYKWLGLEDPQLNIVVTMYVVKMTHKESGHSFHKIGVTKHSVNQRFRGYSAYDKEILHLSCWSLNDALMVEREFSERLTQTTFKFPGKFNGKTECYDLSDTDLASVYETLGPNLKP